MSVIKAAKWNLDLEDKVVNPGIFKTEPFKVYFKPTKRMVPHFGHEYSETKVLTSKNMVTADVVEWCINEVFYSST
eukprot:12557307-Ditylum_brightwellii.AAC.1